MRAEAVFVADSQVAAAKLASRAASADSQVLTAVGLIDIARGMLGPQDGLRWLADRPVAAVADHAVTDQTVRLARAQAPAARGWGGVLATAWHRRSDVLSSYRDHVGDGMDLAMVLESLLHMHYNRMRGLDRDDEKTCRRAARQAAIACLAWTGAGR